MRVLAALFALAMPAVAQGLEPGSYEVAYRLDIPNVEPFAANRMAHICVETANAALPVLSANNPLARCGAENIRLDGHTLTYDILCPGRRFERSRAHAVFHVRERAYHGRIHMVMGGKNMTFTEVQSGRRTGPCRGTLSKR